MTQEDFQLINEAYIKRLKDTSLSFKRYIFDRINWNVRLIGIKGARGVGKTTLLLQHIKSTFKNPNAAFYASLDNYWFQSHTLVELVQWLYSRGIRHIYLDEVHKYPMWSQIVKNLYDTYSDLNIVYTGSSMLEIDNSKVDLSRRQTMYSMAGMSFREYLIYNKIMNINPLTLNELFENHVSYAMEITASQSIMLHYEKYLKNGVYPFARDAGSDFLMRLAEVANLIVESDLPAVEDVSYATVQKAKRLLMVIANNVPLVPNISKLCDQLETTRDVCLKLLYALDRAGLLMMLTRNAKNYKHLVKPEKIYLNNTNLMYAFSPKANVGTMREIFFMNQLSVNHEVTMPNSGDFLVDEKYLFEVGGNDKTFEQIKDEPNSFLAVDNLEVGVGNRIPLWMFGLMY